MTRARWSVWRFEEEAPRRHGFSINFLNESAAPVVWRGFGDGILIIFWPSKIRLFKLGFLNEKRGEAGLFEDAFLTINLILDGSGSSCLDVTWFEEIVEFGLSVTKLCIEFRRGARNKRIGFESYRVEGCRNGAVVRTHDVLMDLGVPEIF